MQAGEFAVCEAPCARRMVVVLPAAAGHGFCLLVRVEGDPRSIAQSSTPSTFDIVIWGIGRYVCYHLVYGGVIRQPRSGQPVSGLWEGWQHFAWSRKDISSYTEESIGKPGEDPQENNRKQGPYPEAIMMSLLRDCGTP